MKRYSPTWWLVVLPTSLIVGCSTFLLAGYFTDWALTTRAVAALAFALAADLAIAALIEVFAPTRVNIGPGERALDSELPSETARVVGGFESSPDGRVSVRGETWRAKRAPDNGIRLTAGMSM